MSRYRVAVDVGGTFTDLIVHDEESGRVAIAKTASIPADPAAAIMAALDQASIAPSDMAFFAHGSPGLRATASRASRAAYGVWSARSASDGRDADSGHTVTAARGPLKSA